jgi:hypothetical protein
MSEERLQEIKDSLTEELNSIDYYGSETAKEGLELYNEVIRLKKQNETLKQNNINEILKNDLSICAKQYKKSEEKLEKANKKIEKANKKIDKAIEYIENTPLYETTYDYNMEEELEIQNVSDETASNDLLNILRGNDEK